MVRGRRLAENGQKKSSKRKGRKRQGQSQIRIWQPQIGGTPITSKTQLHHIINREYPGLKRNPSLPKLLKDAEHHLTLHHKLRGKTRLQRGDLTRLARQTGLPRQKITAWIYGRKPRLYHLIEHSISRTEAQAKLAEIHHQNNGLHSTSDVKHRLNTYYLTPLHEKSPKHKHRLTQCDKYFEALNRLKDGGCYLDIARELAIHHSQVIHWLNGRRPDLVELARRIPREPPAQGNKWLPLSLDKAFCPKDFIQVPTRITDHKQINEVLAQLKPLNNNDMKQWKELFGPLTKEDAFYYLLGLIVSDFEKNKPRTSSTELTLNLSKRYPWSRQLGEAACYYLGKLGIHASKAKDRDSSAGPETCHSWRSQKSPLITWIIRTCLGLQEHEHTTYDAIKADWILNAPRDVRRAFLQGLNDGDGWASVKDQCIGNACEPNIQFVKALLSTFGIEATDDKQRVRIRSQDGIIRAAEIPFFRHATERQRNAEKIAEMMRVRQGQEPGLTSPELVNAMVEMRKKGLSYGEIAEYIYDRFGVSFDHSVVAQRIKSRSS